MTELRLVGDAIELDGATVGMLVPGLRLSLRDQLTEAFALAGEDADTIASLEAEIAALRMQLIPVAPAGEPT